MQFSNDEGTGHRRYGHSAASVRETLEVKDEVEDESGEEAV